MRSSNSTEALPRRRNDWKTIRGLLPYLSDFKGRVALALICLVLAKVANVYVPLMMKDIVDALSQPRHLVVLPIALLVAYGVLRMCASLLGELRDAIFTKVTQRSIRRVALKVFEHLHALSLRFHLERQTGGVSRDIERGSRGISFLLNFMVFNILPTLVEISLVAGILIAKYDYWFAVVTFGTLALYVVFTLAITEWRMEHRRAMNDSDSKANTKAIDSLLNYETVKYFGNEGFEARRYDRNLETWERAAVRSHVSLAALNAGQASIIAVGVSALMVLAARGVVNGTMTLGDLVLVNAFMTQLYMPLNFLGFVYREIRHALADMEKMFKILDENLEIEDRPGAVPLRAPSAAVSFNRVSFAYDERRQILHDVSFEIPAGKSVAVVGHSGSGKSTLARLLFRFYEVNGGSIRINGQDIRDVTQNSLRAHLGIVPQDTVLFNDTIYYNIAYGRPDASRDEVIAAAQAAHIHASIETLPDGYDSNVGERGLKLSGGEKQRVAIARAILKGPSIFVFDEATSALDSKSEQAIQEELQRVARQRTSLIVAHRLSTIVHCDQILVMDLGRIIERGTHDELLVQNGAYAQMWALQQREEREAASQDAGVSDLKDHTNLPS
ncbi:MAG: ABC transporter ATP-binding protein/permease [Betaproteobacteria bacterium]|nr:ABC transporter ATP-binding protein/permease [Betaproteobacteria bacterium]